MKLGLIAMSGIRCQNQELLALGLTLPGFVERSKVIASLPSLGLLTLAGMTPEQVDLEYLEVPDVDTLTDLPGDFDVVAISSFSAQIKQAYTLADRYREAGVTVILGGLHVSAFPWEASHHADSIVVGEAEPVWPRLIQDLRAGALKPMYDGRSNRFNLADAPMPRFDLLDISKYNRLTVQTQRGCPHDCEFCGASIRLAPGYRTKPVAKVIAELRRIKERWPHPFIEFADDNTFANKRHGGELVRAMIPEGVRWFTETDVSVADDPELLELLRESGCAQVLIGLESPVASDVQGLELRANWKKRRVDKYKQAIARIQEAGITVNGCFVLGLDHQDRTCFDAVFNFVRETGLYEVQITVMTPFPNTPLYQRLLGENRLLEPRAWETSTLFDVNFRPKNMSVTELEQGFRDLGRRLYDAAFIEERRRRYFEKRIEAKQARAEAQAQAQADKCVAA